MLSYPRLHVGNLCSIGKKESPQPGGLSEPGDRCQCVLHLCIQSNLVRPSQLRGELCSAEDGDGSLGRWSRH